MALATLPQMTIPPVTPTRINRPAIIRVCRTDHRAVSIGRVRRVPAVVIPGVTVTIARPISIRARCQTADHCSCEQSPGQSRTKTKPAMMKAAVTKTRLRRGGRRQRTQTNRGSGGQNQSCFSHLLISFRKMSAHLFGINEYRPQRVAKNTARSPFPVRFNLDEKLFRERSRFCGQLSALTRTGGRTTWNQARRELAQLQRKLRG